jgi:hypothetical protein
LLTSKQGEMDAKGGACLERHYPRLDAIKAAKILSERIQL